MFSNFCNYVKVFIGFDLCREGDSLVRVGTDVWAQALGILGVNFCLGIWFWEVNFAWALGFLVIFDKMCNT